MTNKNNSPDTLLAWAGLIVWVLFILIIILFYQKDQSEAYLYAGFVMLFLVMGFLFYVVHQYLRLLRDNKVQILQQKLEKASKENAQLKADKEKLQKENDGLAIWKQDREQQRYQKQLLFDFIDKTKEEIKEETKINTDPNKYVSRTEQKVPKELIEDFKKQFQKLLDQSNTLSNKHSNH